MKNIMTRMADASAEIELNALFYGIFFSNNVIYKDKVTKGEV